MQSDLLIIVQEDNMHIWIHQEDVQVHDKWSNFAFVVLLFALFLLLYALFLMIVENLGGS
jgi:hypothetical protein